MSHDKLAELLSAYLDGEADARECEYVEREIARDETARALLDDMRRIRDMTAALPRQSAPEAMAGDVLRLMERQALLGDVNEAPYQAAGSWRPRRAMMSLAAAVAIMVAGGWWYMRPTDQGSADDGSRLAMVTTKPEVRTPEVKSSRHSAARLGRSKGVSRRAKRLDTSSKSVVAKPSSTPTKLATKRNNGLLLEKSVTRLVEKAPVEQRLAAGERLDFLAAHAFANEPIRLRLSLHDMGQLAKARETFKLQLALQGLVDAGSMDALTQAKALRRRAFYYQGKAGTNFRDINQSQLLLRIPAGDMKTLLDHLSIEGLKDKDVALSAGPIVVRGLVQAQSSVSAFQRKPAQAKSHERDMAFSSTSHDDKKTKKPVERKKPGVNIFVEMMKAVGLPEAMLSFDSVASVANPSAKKPLPGRAAGEKIRAVEGLVEAGDTATSTSGRHAKGVGSRERHGRPLVERREAVLQKSRRRDKFTVSQNTLASNSNPAAQASAAQGEGVDQPFITLVVEFVAPPHKKRPPRKPSSGITAKPAAAVKLKPSKSERPQQ